MPNEAMCWTARGERAWTMRVGKSGADWIEVTHSDRLGADAAWRVVSSFDGHQVTLGDAFGTKEAAQGGALLLAMRRLPGSREALHVQLDAVPRAWWWKIMPLDDSTAERRSIFSDRVWETEASAEQAGRAAGAGWYLYVFGPRSAQAFGRLPA